MKIYTKKGDGGMTSLFGGKRISKSDERIEAYGTVDELNAFLGLLRDHLKADDLRQELKYIQDRLFDIGANLASDPERPNAAMTRIEASDTALLEASIDRMEEQLEPLRSFILPGGHPVVSYCHLARCVCRRAERLVIKLSAEESVDAGVMEYMNRLSDYLFVLGRKIGKDFDVVEVVWNPR